MSGNATTASNNNSNNLSPFDLTGIGMGFGLYRPRRPSYTFATKCNRQRNESYRYATRRDNADSTSEVSSGEDFIEGVLRNKARKISYLKATKRQDDTDSSSSATPKVGVVVCGNAVAPVKVDMEKDHGKHSGVQPGETDAPCNNYILEDGQYSSDDNAIYESQNYANHKCAAQSSMMPYNFPSPDANKVPTEQPGQSQHPLHHEHLNNKATSTKIGPAVMSAISFNKNLVVLCVSFILVFSSYRAIQNLQSSMHTQDNLGILTMMVVHISMIFACLISPVIINVFKAKWALCIGILCFLIWFAANFHPTFYTLIPTSLLLGLGQGILWNAESSYILKLAFDKAKATRGHLDQEMFRFHGIFLACFQTTHIWGNLISSLLLSQHAADIYTGGNATMSDYYSAEEVSNITNDFPVGDDAAVDIAIVVPHCGALHRCKGPTVAIFPGIYQGPVGLSPVLWKLMTSYIFLGIVSFGTIVCFLDRIGARSDPDKGPAEIVLQHLKQLIHHDTLKLLVPLLLFNGMQQGFIYSDYNQYFVTCTLGIDYVGYCMITLGVANVLGAVFVAVFSHKIPREVVLGFGGIVHIALMIGYLIWIPDNRPLLFFVLAAAWGICDSVWQTQCKTLICLTCTDQPEIAFTNYRLVQSIGLAIMFGSGTWMCVSAKLYLLMTLLVVAIMFYVLAEYRLRHEDDDVFEDP